VNSRFSGVPISISLDERLAANQPGKARDAISLWLSPAKIIAGRSSWLITMTLPYGGCVLQGAWGKLARIAAAGADDNHSATAASCLRTVFMEMSKAGQLESDIWLVHLTGEEFLRTAWGAEPRRKAGDGRLEIQSPGRKALDLQCEDRGRFVLDMIAHNRPVTAMYFKFLRPEP